ncbi:uncharacterized protein [Temnothorax nylanderi]|uniref:uncharacterized protein n=1 Tax=Temnothorax nylanderi TaxID=102681 RepID=UPI003A8690C9
MDSTNSPIRKKIRTKQSGSVILNKKNQNVELQRTLSQISIASSISSIDEEENNSEENSDASNDDDIKTNITEEQKMLAAINKSTCLDGTYFKVDKSKSSTVTGDVVAVCQFCNPTRALKGKFRIISNFTTHLKRKHANVYNEYLEYAKQKRHGVENTSVIDRKRWSCVLNQEEFEQNITNFVLKYMIPFRAVEDPSFRKIFDDFKIKRGDTRLKHLTCYSLAKRVDRSFKEMLQEIGDAMSSVINGGGFVCTTADVWTGGSRRYLGVTASWIHPETLEKKSAALACKRFSGTHCFDAVADLLSKIHVSFKLTPETIRATVTDNGSNFIKAFKEFGIVIPNDPSSNNSQDEYENNDDAFDVSIFDEDVDSDENCIQIDNEFSNECDAKLPRHIRCASHTLNLIAKTDVLKAIKNCKRLNSKHNNVMHKCTAIWKSLRSPKFNENLKAYLGIALQRPVVTRWNSSYDCIKKLLTVKEKLLNNDSIKFKKPLNDLDFQYLEEYVRCAAPLANAIDRLQADNCYYGILLPTLVSLKYQMNMLIINEDIIDCKPMIEAIVDGVDRRFEKIFDFSKPDIDAVIAAISHPQFKGRWLVPYSRDVQKNIHERFLVAVSRESSQEVQSSVNQNYDDDFEFGHTNLTIDEFRPSLSQGELTAEVTRHLKSKEIQLDMLENYPSIRKTFVKYNTPLPSSAPVERMFSYTTMMNLPKYNRLKDEHFEQRVLLKANAGKKYR